MKIKLKLPNTSTILYFLWKATIWESIPITENRNHSLQKKSFLRKVTFKPYIHSNPTKVNIHLWVNTQWDRMSKRTSSSQDPFLSFSYSQFVAPMLRPVWPSLFFWWILGFIFSYLSVWQLYSMEIFKKRHDFLVTVGWNLTIFFSWYIETIVLSLLWASQLNPNSVHLLLQGRERLEKTVGATLLLCGNILVYYYSQKSVAGILVFLFLACHCLCTLCYLQPYTDFGVLDFLLSASLNQSLTLFGLRRINTWLVLVACVAVAGLRYWLEPLEPKPLQPPGEARNLVWSLDGGSWWSFACSTVVQQIFCVAHSNLQFCGLLISNYNTISVYYNTSKFARALHVTWSYCNKDDSYIDNKNVLQWHENLLNCTKIASLS